MKTTYHGWIYINKTEGFNDHFEAVHYGSEGGDYKTVDCGYGATGAAKAVDFFETDGGLGLGPIKLLPTPLGLRVYTEQEEVGDVYEVTLTRPSTSISATGDPIVDALRDLVEVAMRVSGLWDHTGTNMIDGYPPRLGSWDEFVADLAVWSDHQANLRKVK